jgi:hypothetical protein
LLISLVINAGAYPSLAKTCMDSLKNGFVLKVVTLLECVVSTVCWAVVIGFSSQYGAHAVLGIWLTLQQFWLQWALALVSDNSAFLWSVSVCIAAPNLICAVRMATNKEFSPRTRVIWLSLHLISVICACPWPAHIYAAKWSGRSQSEPRLTDTSKSAKDTYEKARERQRVIASTPPVPMLITRIERIPLQDAYCIDVACDNDVSASFLGLMIYPVKGTSEKWEQLTADATKAEQPYLACFVWLNKLKEPIAVVIKDAVAWTEAEA